MRQLVAIALIGLAVLLTACTGLSARPIGSGSSALGLTVFRPADRDPVPPLAGATLTGRPLTASAYAGGSPLVINVWASWCVPCQRELPLLARVARHGVRVLGIDERDSTPRAASFAADQGLTYPSLRDRDGHLLASLSLLPRTGIPSTLFVGRDGRVRARVVGPLDPTILRQALRTARS